jgi:hypothetical protein
MTVNVGRDRLVEDRTRFGTAVVICRSLPVLMADQPSSTLCNAAHAGRLLVFSFQFNVIFEKDAFDNRGLMAEIPY